MIKNRPISLTFLLTVIKIDPLTSKFFLHLKNKHDEVIGKTNQLCLFFYFFVFVRCACGDISIAKVEISKYC